MSPRRTGLRILPLAVMSTAALAGVPGAAEPLPASTLRACAAIGAPTERLACYDRLAGRAAQPQAAPVPAAPTAAAHGATAVDDSFGLYAAEHPAPPKPPAELKLKVVALGVNAAGDPTVTLDGGQLWKLDDSDPLLAIGDRVSIHRAAFGSFLMYTPSGRRHRVQRLR